MDWNRLNYNFLCHIEFFFVNGQLLRIRSVRLLIFATKSSQLLKWWLFHIALENGISCTLLFWKLIYEVNEVKFFLKLGRILESFSSMLTLIQLKFRFITCPIKSFFVTRILGFSLDFFYRTYSCTLGETCVPVPVNTLFSWYTDNRATLSWRKEGNHILPVQFWKAQCSGFLEYYERLCLVNISFIYPYRKCTKSCLVLYVPFQCGLGP